jgi:hypothetical protein
MTQCGAIDQLYLTTGMVLDMDLGFLADHMELSFGELGLSPSCDVMTLSDHQSIKERI